jgi:tetratricopeptide (TPR) repeat protein
MRLQFWVLLLAIWVLSFLVLLPATQSPWHGLEREFLAAPTASLRSVDLGSLGKMAPGEFPGWWSLLEQRRWTSDPLGFRLVNLFLVSAIVLFFALALAGENLSAVAGRPSARIEILPPVALFAFHPFLADLTASAYARPILLAGFFGFIAYLLLRRAFAEQVERPGSLVFGVFFYLIALTCHPAAAVVLAALTWPILLQSQPAPRNWMVLVLLALVSLVYFALGMVWAQSPFNFFLPEFFQSVPTELRSLGIVAAFFPFWGWPLPALFGLVVIVPLLVFTFARRPTAPAAVPASWTWLLVFLLGLVGAAVALGELPGIALAGSLLAAWLGYGLMIRLRESTIRPARFTRSAAAALSLIALGFLVLASTRSWSYNCELDQARRQVARFPEWPLCWRDYGLALVGVHRDDAGRAVLERTVARFPDDLQTRLAAVETAVEQNHLDRAKTILDQLRPDAPERWEIILSRCVLAARQGELADAESYCRAAADERPASAPALNYLATVHLRSNRLEDASMLLDQAIKLEPRNASVLNNLGYLAELKQDLDRALRFYREAARLDPDQALYLKNLAHVLYLSRKIPEAIANLEIVVRADPNDLQAHANLAQLFFEIQDIRRAQDQIISVLRIAPGSPQAEQMRLLLHRLGQNPPLQPHPGRRLQR